MNSPPNVPKPPGIAGLLLSIAVGLALIAGAIRVLHPYSRAKIQLQRDMTNQVAGSISYVFSGVSIFWQSLDGLDHLEDQSYTLGHYQGRRQRYRGDRVITRLGFVDAEGRTLAWSKRAAIWNDSDALGRFLDGIQPKYDFLQEPPFQTTLRDIARMSLSAPLVIVGLFFVLIGFRVPVLKVRKAKHNRPR